MWSNAKVPEFADHLNNDILDRIKRGLGNPDTPIDFIVKELQELFVNAADETLGAEREYEIDISKKSRPIRFDRETRRIRNRYYAAKRANDGSEEKQKDVIKASKEYKKAVSKAKALQRKKKIQKLRNSKSKNPKYYWSVLGNKNNHKIRSSNITPTLDYFYNEFKNLAGNGSHEVQSITLDENKEETRVPIINRELAEQILNTSFTAEEIYLCVKRLKNGKACGIDKILNEFIKSTFDKMKQVYVDLFNRVLATGQIPESWTVGTILPIYKNKGDRMDFNNYRDITILSCLGKLFTSVINSRLNKFADETKLINENQTGFRKNYSTLDHIFLLKNLIDLSVINNQKLYCAFVDYKKSLRHSMEKCFMA